ncbi:hypothetical protein MKC54_20610 [[Clostridium] innocuum]|jgi:hypothetical protein|nr:hypothetical protein [[Clostridium] innocuum]MCR0579303.1 hypothetical protein [[Clostridium] innocuum]
MEKEALMSEPERTDTYDKKYYEVNLPGYLEKDIKQLVEAKNREDIYYDKYIDEVYGSINSALYSYEITKDQADYLREKYCFSLFEW